MRVRETYVAKGCEVMWLWNDLKNEAACVMVAMLALGGPAVASEKALVLGAGDCRDGVLLGSVRDFQDLSRGLLRGDLVEHEDVLAAVRPQPIRSLDDLARQVETARSLLFNSQNERALEVVNDALAGLERASPQVGPWATTANALMLSAQVQKNLEHTKLMNEAFRRILRVEPSYHGDTDAWPPSTIRALEAVRKELQRSKKGLLQVTSLGKQGASVFVDGREVGKTPLRLELSQGTYRVSVLAKDVVSFPRVVNLGREESVQVDLAFEGSLSAQVPLCLNGEDSGPVRLGAAVGASRVVVLRNTAQDGNPPYMTGVLYESGQRLRSAGVRPRQLRDLMMYLFTGSPDISKEPPPPVVVPAAQVSPVLQASDTVARGRSPLKPIAFAALGVGAAAAGAGVVVFAMTPKIRLDANGYVVAEDVGKVGSARTQQGVGVGLMVGGAALSAAACVALLLAPGEQATVSAAVVPMIGGAGMVLGGTFQ